jgi:CheY-like chemotaxis protein
MDVDFSLADAPLPSEDNLVNQKLATKLLEGCGHKVEIADKCALLSSISFQVDA